MTTENFCNDYVKTIFKKWDKNDNDLLERSELANWLKTELMDTPISHRHTVKGMKQLIKNADSNKDSKIDRWELFTYCLKAYTPYDD